MEVQRVNIYHIENLNIIEDIRNKILLSNNDDKRLKHIHIEQMLLKYVKVNG